MSSGMRPTNEMRSIWEEVNENHRLLGTCSRHRFQGEHRLGQRMTCLECGGTLTPSDILMYARGYAAAGGKLEDIWPAFKE